MTKNKLHMFYSSFSYFLVPVHADSREELQPPNVSNPDKQRRNVASISGPNEEEEKPKGT